MKTLTLIMTLSFSLSAFATQLFTVERITDGQGKTGIALNAGFHEDGFGGKIHACYRGPAAGVCAMIKRSAGHSLRAYQQGEHGYFEVVSCELVGDKVELEYTRRTDYGDSDVTMTIANCDDVI